MSTAATVTAVESELRLVAHPSQLGLARGLAEEAAAGFGFDDEETHAFTFAVNEAVSNSIEHGSPFPDGTILLEMTVEDGALTARVTDCGDFVPGLPKTEALPDRGRGLAFMAVMVDEVELKPCPDRTVVRLAKRRSQEG